MDVWRNCGNFRKRRAQSKLYLLGKMCQKFKLFLKSMRKIAVTYMAFLPRRCCVRLNFMFPRHSRPTIASMAARSAAGSNGFFKKLFIPSFFP